MHALYAAFLLILIPCIACRRPESVLRERPVQGVSFFIPAVPDQPAPAANSSMPTPVAGAHLAQGLGVPLLASDSALPGRTLRVRVKAHRRSEYQGKGLAGTWLMDVGGGAFVGAFTWGGIFPLDIAGAGVGALAGLCYGPAHFLSNRATTRELGYLPWNLQGEWLVEEWIPPSSPKAIASGKLPSLDLKPFLPRLAPEEGPEDSRIRQECLIAYENALVKYLEKKGVRVNGVAPLRK